MATASVALRRWPSTVRGWLRLGWRRLGPGGRLAFWLLVTLRLGLGLVALIGLRLRPPRPGGGEYADLLIRGGEPWSTLLSAWQRYDALAYQQIAQHGYEPGALTTSFYPLYPLLSRLAAPLLGGHILLAQLLVTSVAFLAAMWLLYQVARLDGSPRAARLAVLTAAFFPASFFLLAPFTESLFLALTLAAVWQARRDRPWAAGALAFAASLTRPHGLLLVLPLAVEYLRQCQRQGRRPGLALLAALAPLAGTALFFGYLQLIVGEARTPLAAQIAIGQQFVSPVQVLTKSWAALGRPDSLALIVGFSLIGLLGFSLLALLAVRRLPLMYTLYLWPSLLIMATREMPHIPLMSLPRYLLVLFPGFIMLGLLLARRPWLAAGWLIVSLILQVLLFDHFAHGNLVA